MRYKAKEVRDWDTLLERGFGYFITEDSKKVWFHFKHLPREIWHWFKRNSSQERLIPIVSFSIKTTAKGKEADDIRLEPNPEREIIWCNGSHWVSLRTGMEVELWPDYRMPIARSEFWSCEIFPILPGCQDAGEKQPGDRFSKSRPIVRQPQRLLVRPCQLFRLGIDEATEQIHAEIIKKLETNLVETFSNPVLDAIASPLSLLSDRLEKLDRSFGLQLQPETQISLQSVIRKRYASRLTEEIASRLEKYLPGISYPIWEQFSTKLPLVALDLESDGNTIWQFAIVGQEGAIVDLKNPSDEEVRRGFAQIPSGLTVAGHNLIEWDLKILEKKGCAVENLKIHDTLKEEMFLRPLRCSYALNTAHTAVEDSQKTLELARNQFLRRLDLPGVRETAEKESDKFFLNFQKPAWIDRMEPLLHGRCKTLIVGPSEYAATLMLPPVTQVIQATAKPISFQEGGEALFFQYVSEVEKRGYTAIAELAPSIFRQEWELGTEKSIPHIPPNVRIVYCAFADFARAAIRDKIQAWMPEESYLFFPEIIPFESRRRIRKLKKEEYEDKIEQQGLWTRFAVGRSYVSLKLLGLKKEHFLQPGDDSEGLTAELTEGITCFWLQKTIAGRIELWGCLTRENLTIHNRHLKSHPLAENMPALWQVPLLLRRESDLPADSRLTPETPYRADYWQALLPFIVHYSQPQGRAIIAANESGEIPHLEELFSHLFPIFAFRENSSDLRRIVRQFDKCDRGLLIVPMRLVERCFRDLQALSENGLANLTVILESLPVHMTPVLGAVQQDLAPSNPRFFQDEFGDDEQNIDGENEREEYEEEAESEPVSKTEKYPEETSRFVSLTEKVSACIPVLTKTALWLSEEASVRLICLDPRLKALSNRHLLKINALTELPAVLTFKSELHQPGEFEIPDENTWKQAISRAFIPGLTLSDEQVRHLRYVLPRNFDCRLISLPTGGGKSLLFQAPALYRGHVTRRLTVVISPLKALIKDQQRSLWEKGFSSTVDGLTGDLTREEIENSYRRIRGGECLLVYTAPERFRSQRFREVLEERFNRDGEPEFWVFDEAHCISLWGLDFRPDYFYAAKFVKEQRSRGRKAPILLLSATINNQVRSDLEKILNLSLQQVE